MMEVGMNNMMEDFFSSKWNLYGLQIGAASLMIMVLHNYLTIFQMCIMALCVYLIGICQRILGVTYGMVWSQIDENKKKKIDLIVSEVKKMQKERKSKRKKK